MSILNYIKSGLIVYFPTVLVFNYCQSLKFRTLFIKDHGIDKWEQTALNYKYFKQIPAIVGQSCFQLVHLPLFNLNEMTKGSYNFIPLTNMCIPTISMTKLNNFLNDQNKINYRLYRKYFIFGVYHEQYALYNRFNK